jgi:predicted ABC-type ATPase
MPEIFIIAGCNGAGKTTAAYNLLPDVFDTTDFINADEIARGIDPHNVEAAAFAAGKIMLSKIRTFIDEQKSFAFETTLSGLSYLKIIEEAKAKEFKVTLFFVYLSDVEIAIARVALRVSKGGHNITNEVIKRRYLKGLNNLPKYLKIMDNWYIIDNSLSDYKTIAKSILGNTEIFNFEVLKNITRNEY